MSRAARLALALWLAGCAGLAADGTPDLLGAGSRFLPPAPAGVSDATPLALSAEAAAADVIVVYLPGSAGERVADACETARPGLNIPHLAAGLAGEPVAGRTLRLFAFCTPTRTGGFLPDAPGGTPKVERRADDLARLLAAFAARGVAPSRLFVMGHSAGAWAGLLVKRARPARLNAVIGFAPAFAGPAEDRPARWVAKRAEHLARLARGPALPALLFAFEGDPFEPPAALAPLAAIPGVELRALPADRLAGRACAGVETPHRLAFARCFEASQRGAILDFIARRLAAGG